MSLNSAKVSEAFSKQAPVFDQISTGNKLSEYLRTQFREEVLSVLKPNSEILELNCGTGLDAVFFAGHGHSILATDNAPGMIEQVEEKINSSGLQNKIHAKLLSYHNIKELAGKKFDHIISNFGGLNCTDNLKDVLLQLAPLLKEGGMVTLVLMPRISPWEIIQIFKGKFRTAFRRFKKSTPANVEGVNFSCYYYNPGYVISTLRKEFKVRLLKGIFITVPPEFNQDFVNRHPRIFSFLTKTDRLLSTKFPFNTWCDHYLICLQKID